MYGNPDQVFEYLSDSDAVTCTAAANITGKTLVKLAAGGTDQLPTVTTCAAGDVAYGVAAWTVLEGERVTVIRKGVVSITAGGALTPGPVEAGAGGTVVAATTGERVGHVHADAATNDDAAVALTL